MLLHENLCLRLEVDRLNLEMEKFKMLEVQAQTNSKLKYINHKPRGKEDTTHDINDNKKSSLSNCVKEIDRKEKRESNCEEVVHHVDNVRVIKLGKPKTATILFENTRKINISSDSINSQDITNSKDDILENTRTEKNVHYVNQLVETPSQTASQSTEFSQSLYEAARTRSAPEIVRRKVFVDDT